MKEQKVVMIASGVGYLSKEVAKVFASHGFVVALLYRDKQEEVYSFLSSLPGVGHKAYMCDLSLKSQVDDVMEKVHGDFSYISGCIFLAGVKPLRKKIAATTEQEMNDQLHGTFMTGFNVLTKGISLLQEQGEGFLIAVTTAGVIKREATSNLGGYIPSKFALQGLVIALQEEYKNTPIGIYSIAPGFMEGGMNADFPKAFIEMMKQKNKVSEFASASSVASGIYTVAVTPKQEVISDTVVIAPEYN